MAHAGFQSKRPKRKCRQGSFNPVNIEQLVIDELSNIFAFGDVELHQKIKVAAGREQLGMDFPKCNGICDLIRRSGVTTDLDENTVHESDFRCMRCLMGRVQ